MENPTITPDIEDDDIQDNIDPEKGLQIQSDDDDDSVDTRLLLTDLPDVILMMIMEFLCLKDKYYLSVTCQRFFELFKHPGLWKFAHIILLGGYQGKRRSQWQKQNLMPNTMAEIVKRFSHLFQHLSLKTPRIIQPFDDISSNLLSDLKRECRLNSLTLEVGVLESKDQEIQGIRNYFSNTKDVYLLTGVLRKAVRLKHLKIVSWPFHADTDEDNIYQAILSNEKLRSLESLSLFYIDNKQQWTGRMPKLPTPSQTRQVISFLPNLTRISLRSPMIDDELIQKISLEKRKILKLLQMLIVWSRTSSSHEGFDIPDISDASWDKLKKSSPLLQVEIVIHIRIPFDEVCTIFKPRLPLSSISILKYGQCDGMLIDSIASKYGDSLISFVTLCESDNCDSALLNLVKGSKHLNHLVYHGDINYKTVMQIVTWLKENNRTMKVFEFNEKNIKTNDLLSVENDDDIVIRQDEESQEYIIAAIQSWHYDEELHQNKIDQMVDFVRDVYIKHWILSSG